MSVPVSFVLAVAENGVIGANGDMPWRLSTDLRRFKKLTDGTPMVMGRKTFESIGKPLPGRTSIVVTRNTDWKGDGAIVAHSADAALDLALSIAEEQGAKTVSVVGGGEIYRQLLGRADVLHVTRVHASPPGDAYFADPDPVEWALVSSEAFAATEVDSAPTTYCIYERKDR